MNAAEIAREYLESSNQRIEDDDTAADITDADVHVLCRAVLDAEAQDHSGCQYSTGICGSITAGRGKLDENGYFEFPCASCARIANLEEHLRALQCVHDAYRARVEKVIGGMRRTAPHVKHIRNAVNNWAALLTEKGDG